jgi:DMSO/TMAO reductase YedYZ molybdopterin-dependent catalytic subunit
MKRIIFLVVLLMNLMLLVSCTGTDGTSGATESRYQVSEIKEYNGVRLDPSVGLRDNSIKGIQHVDISAYKLKVSGLVKNPVSLSYDEVLALPAFEKLIILHCVEGWDATVLWKGVLIKDIIGKASAESTANTVIFHSVDGYTTSLPLQDIIDKNIILAYSSNGITLPPELGYPFIVVAEDKLGYKWARWVTEIELSNNPNYKGYWETRGYDNNADVK